jgi:hypothetical protein
MRTKITATEIGWIVTALNQEIADMKAAMDNVEDDSPVYALGELFITGRENLKTKLMDCVAGNGKTIYVTK